MVKRKSLSKALDGSLEKTFHADFIVYQNGKTLTQRVQIQAPNSEAAWRKATRMTTSAKEFPATAVVRIPKTNIKPAR